MAKGWIVAISLFFGVAYAASAQSVEVSFNARDGNIFYHTVEQGQNVYRLAIMYNVAEEDIYRLNPNSRQFIRIGEVLRIPQKTTVASTETTFDDMYRFHTIQPGETLFGVSRMYKISQEELANANMGLTPQTFAAGRTIRIPTIQSTVALPVTEIRKVTKEIDYTVQRRETMFNLTRRFNVTSNQLIQLNPDLKRGLRAGMVLKIPVETEEIVTVIPGSSELDINTLLAFRSSFQRVDEVKIALLLPFITSDRRISGFRFEFYEGILLAVESMRNAGVTVDLSVFDIGEGAQTTRSVLHEIPFNTHLIIGGITNEQIELIADFASKNKIKYVVPFPEPSNIRLTSTNANIFQVYAPSQYLQTYAAAMGTSLFANYHIIFVNTNDPNQREDKTPFVNVFKADLTQRNISFQNLTYNENTFPDDINAILSPSKPNVIVPMSSSIETLNKIRGPLRVLLESQPTKQISLFGYPEWQQHIDLCLDDFYALNAHIYTPFFANSLSLDVQQFTAKYRYWFNKNMIQAYPRYAMLGYDIGRYFMVAIHTLGSNFENNIRQVNYESMQYGFNFERISNWGGFINTNLYMVRFNRDYTITRAKR